MTERMQRLAQFCVETRFEDLPPALVEQAKRHILDTFGAALAGADSAVALQARQVFGAEPGTVRARPATYTVGPRARPASGPCNRAVSSPSRPPRRLLHGFH